MLRIIRQVDDYISPKGRHVKRFLCLCSCGNNKIIRSDHLLHNRIKSCGCLRKEKFIKLLKIYDYSGKNNSSYIHGMTGHRFYICWKHINSRCNNKNIAGYKNYGGRRIRCLWKSFEEFKKDMYRSYQYHVKKYGEKQTTIDRIDNDGNYCKSNCKWSTYKEQANNKRPYAKTRI